MSHTKNLEIYDKLLDNDMSRDAAGSSGHGEKKPSGPLLSRLDQITSSKEFLEECTYFIGLKGKRNNSFPKLSFLI